MLDPGTECLFCQIARREVSSHVVYEDDLVFAFLDLAPIRPGHTQIVPKAHYNYFDDLPILVGNRIFEVGQRLAKAMKAIYAIPRVGFLFTGGDIAHAHAHIVPIHEHTDITSRQYIAEEHLTFRSTPRASPHDLRRHAASLIAALNADAADSSEGR